MNTLKLISLGCSKNTVDSEKIAGLLALQEWQIIGAEGDQRSDVTLINTCGFIGDAKDESVQYILRAITQKEVGRTDKVLVMGCLSQRYKEQLQEELPEVDTWFGVNEIDKVIEAITNAPAPANKPEPRILSTYPHSAYLKISEGCDRSCSFCAIPVIRGKHVSTPIEILVQEAKVLAEKGVKELILVAQDVTYYGLDLYGERKITELLKELLKISQIEWFRLQYLYPHGFPKDLLALMAEEPRICKYIDIPLQHIDSEVLHSMRRATDEEQTRALLAEMREKLPDAAIRTTLITGYPNESPEAYEKLKQFVQEQKFDRLGVFTYSHEEDTPAHTLEDSISQEEKQRRADEIMQLQEQISLEKNQAKIGSVVRVLVDRQEEDMYVGRTEYDSLEVDNLVYIDSDKPLQPGKFYQVKITDAEPYDLYAEYFHEQ